MLHRIEDYGSNHIEGEYLELSFETEYRGIWQCRWTLTGMDQFASEPPFESLRSHEQDAIEEIGQIAFYFTHGEVPKV